MVSVALSCALLATSASARDDAEVMGLMHTNAKIEMAVASSGEVDIVDKHLVLENDWVQFKSVEGGRCMSSFVDKDSRLTFEDCDDSSLEQMWTKRSDNSYESVAKGKLEPAQELCPRVGAYVNCGRNSTVLGSCPGFKLWKTNAGLLLQDSSLKTCLAVYMKGVIDQGYKDLVTTTPGGPLFCGVSGFGSTWEMIPLASSSTIATASAKATATAAAAAKAAAEAKIAAEAAAPTIEVMSPGTACSAGASLDEDECKVASEKRDKWFKIEDSADTPTGCYQKNMQLYFNTHQTGKVTSEEKWIWSICRAAAVGAKVTGGSTDASKIASEAAMDDVGQVPFVLVGSGMECDGDTKDLIKARITTSACALMVASDPECSKYFEDRTHSTSNSQRCTCLRKDGDCKQDTDPSTNRYMIEA